MPSPFPGMDPFLEANVPWRDFHTRYCVALATDLGALVRPRYAVQVEANIFLREPSAEERRQIVIPDVSLSNRGLQNAGLATQILPAPAYVYAPVRCEEETIPFLQVVDRQSRAVVCVIEVLSPSNKDPGRDREAHWDKVRRILRSPAAYVEIDLLRGGPRLPWTALPPCDNYALVSRPADRPRIDFWPGTLRDPLPAIPIPLQTGEAEPILPLRAAFDRIYDEAGYAFELYADTPAPPLPPADAAWAAEIVSQYNINIPEAR
jgi:hypothetical protein